MFVTKHFFYFGRSPVQIPAHLSAVIRSTLGVRFSDGDLAKDFVAWLESKYEPGLRDLPRDFSDKRGDVGPMITTLED